MRPSEFEAIRPYLQEAIDGIDRYLKWQQEIEEKAPKSWEAARAGLLPKANLRTFSEAERQEEVRIFRSQPIARIEHAYPWRHSSAQAAVWLRKGEWITEADAIDAVLSELPTGPVDGRNPENMARHSDAIRAGAEQVKKVLTTCLAGSKDQDKQFKADLASGAPSAFIGSELSGTGSTEGKGEGDKRGDKKKLSPRGLTQEARKCAKTYKATLKAGKKTSMRTVILDYIGENGGSFHSIKKSLSAHPEAWKTPAKGDKTGDKAV